MRAQKTSWVDTAGECFSILMVPVIAIYYFFPDFPPWLGRVMLGIFLVAISGILVAGLVMAPGELLRWWRNRRIDRLAERARIEDLGAFEADMRSYARDDGQITVREAMAQRDEARRAACGWITVEYLREHTRIAGLEAVMRRRLGI